MILGISLNEFLAGEDIAQENIVQKSEENIIGVATDSKHKQKRLKAMICILLVITILTLSVIGVTVYRDNQPKNFIAPVPKSSVEMQTINLLAGPDGAHLYKFTTTDEYKTFRLYFTEYHDGEIVNKDRMELGFDGIGSPENGEILIMPDFDNYLIKIVISTDGSKYSTERSILEGVTDREFYGRSGTGIEAETSILYDTEQPLAGLIYDDNEMWVMDIFHILDGESDALKQNDYVYLFSYEFCKE